MIRIASKLILLSLILLSCKEQSLQDPNGASGTKELKGDVLLMVNGTMRLQSFSVNSDGSLLAYSTSLDSFAIGLPSYLSIISFDGNRITLIDSSLTSFSRFNLHFRQNRLYYLKDSILMSYSADNGSRTAYLKDFKIENFVISNNERHVAFTASENIFTHKNYLYDMQTGVATEIPGQPVLFSDNDKFLIFGVRPYKSLYIQTGEVSELGYSDYASHISPYYINLVKQGEVWHAEALDYVTRTSLYDFALNDGYEECSSTVIFSGERKRALIAFTTTHNTQFWNVKFYRHYYYLADDILRKHIEVSFDFTIYNTFLSKDGSKIYTMAGNSIYAINWSNAFN